MRLVRADVEVPRQDFIRFAARGLSERVAFSHALKNTLVPVITVAGLQLGSIAGLGDYYGDCVSVARRGADVYQCGFLIFVMSAYLLLVGTLFVVINLIVDLFIRCRPLNP